MLTIPKQVIQICQTLKDHKFECYIVGGSIRDLLLKESPTEWDLTTNAKPEEVSKLFKKVVPTGIKFGTVTILFDNKSYEVTTFRKDEKYSDGRHPDNVKFSAKLDDDLSRRDFTINAIAYDPLSKKLVDKYKGQEDLKKKTIRCVGKAKERFSEDGLRSIRACRFAAQLEFEIEKKTLEAIKSTKTILKKIAPERIHDELIKLLKAIKPSIGIEYMLNTGLLEMIIPELIKCLNIEQPKPFHKHDVFWHSLYSMDSASQSNYQVRLAALLHDIAKPECQNGETFYNHDQVGEKTVENILKRLKFSNTDIKKVKTLVKNHMFNYQNSWSDSAVRRFIRRIGKENILDLFELRKADIAAMNQTKDNDYLIELNKRIQKVYEEDNALHTNDLALNGNQIMDILNIKPGPQIGKALDYLLEKVLDNPELNTASKLKELLKDYEK